jgi:hypothetical protein
VEAVVQINNTGPLLPAPLAAEVMDSDVMSHLQRQGLCRSDLTDRQQLGLEKKRSKCKESGVMLIAFSRLNSECIR